MKKKKNFNKQLTSSQKESSFASSHRAFLVFRAPSFALRLN